MGSVDRRVESEESGDEEGKKHIGGIVADLSEQSLKDGVEQGKEDPEGFGCQEPSPCPEGSVPGGGEDTVSVPERATLLLSGPWGAELW